MPTPLMHLMSASMRWIDRARYGYLSWPLGLSWPEHDAPSAPDMGTPTRLSTAVILLVALQLVAGPVSQGELAL